MRDRNRARAPNAVCTKRPAVAIVVYRHGRDGAQGGGGDAEAGGGRREE